jgi:hypothetical protein
LPLFHKDAYDLPLYATITVDYTISSFIISNSVSANMALLFNILFVVLLAEKINDKEDQ